MVRCHLIRLTTRSLTSCKTSPNFPTKRPNRLSMITKRRNRLSTNKKKKNWRLSINQIFRKRHFNPALRRRRLILS
eukprot:17630_6